MKQLISTFSLILFLACTNTENQFEYLLPNGLTETINIIPVVHMDSLFELTYESGELFRRSTLDSIEDVQMKKSYWYYKSGQIMDYKLYINNNLFFYSRYDEQGNVIQLNGPAILLFKDPASIVELPIKKPWLRRIHTFSPPNLNVKIWLDGNNKDEPMRQITENHDNLYSCLIEGDTTAYIFQLSDTLIEEHILLWSIETESKKVLKAGRLIDRFKGVNNGS